MSLLTTHSVSSGDETAGVERCEEEEDQTLKAGRDQAACMAKADQTALMEQEDEPAWLAEEDQTGKGERGERPQIEDEGMAEQNQSAVVNKDQNHGQDICEDKGNGQEGTLDKEEDDQGKCQEGTLDKEEDDQGKCQAGTLDKEEDGKGRGGKPMEEEDKEVEDEPEEVLDSRTPSRSATLIRQFSTRPNCIGN